MNDSISGREIDQIVRIRCVELASKELLTNIERKGRRISIASLGSEERRYLDSCKANANVGGEQLKHIILLPDARKVEVLEEFLHGTQFQLRIVQRRGLEYAEAHVKRFMIKHAQLLRLADCDTVILRRMLGEE